MSHADSILNYMKPCVECGRPRGSRYLIKCPACSAKEGPVTEEQIERIIREHDDSLSRTEA